MVVSGGRRVHIVLPEELLQKIDARTDKGHRSQFILQAIEEKINHLERIEAFERVAGSIADGEVPEWNTRESTEAWLRELREG